MNKRQEFKLFDSILRDGGFEVIRSDSFEVNYCKEFEGNGGVRVMQKMQALKEGGAYFELLFLNPSGKGGKYKGNGGWWHVDRFFRGVEKAIKKGAGIEEAVAIAERGEK